MIQGTAEWFEARCGKLTASRVFEATKRIKTGWAATRSAVMAELVAERLAGTVANHYVSPAMVWGSQNQGAATQAYEFLTGNAVEEAGYYDHPSIEMSGASPDGFVGTEGGLEIKCPTTETHIETLLAQAVPPENMPQILWGMACTKRQWWDFVSFDPRMPLHLQLFVARVERDETAIARLEADVQTFLAELAERVSRLQAIYSVEAADAA